jgi:methylmalonyl-CoA mutase C-terminal domain/subunit
MKEKGLDDILVLAGGIIPDEDFPALKRSGISEIFGPGTPTEVFVKFIKKQIGEHRLIQ